MGPQTKVLFSSSYDDDTMGNVCCTCVGTLPVGVRSGGGGGGRARVSVQGRLRVGSVLPWWPWWWLPAYPRRRRRRLRRTLCSLPYLHGISLSFGRSAPSYTFKGSLSPSVAPLPPIPSWDLSLLRSLRSLPYLHGISLSPSVAPLPHDACACTLLCVDQSSVRVIEQFGKYSRMAQVRGV